MASCASRRTTWSRVAAMAVVVVAAVHLERAPGQPGLLGRGEQHPDVGVGGDHGGDVATLDHDAAVVRGDQRALPRGSARPARPRLVAMALTAAEIRGSGSPPSGPGRRR